jgi:cytochrome b subunit of formate dehydrogenase
MTSTPLSSIRFGPRHRLEHLVVMTAVAGLALTGLPQRFADAGWAQWMVERLGGIAATRALHRVLGLALALTVLEHLAAALVQRLRGRGRGLMRPRRQDLRDALDNLRYGLGLSAEAPRFDHFDYRQKLEYFALLGGGLTMILSGLALWRPALATRLLPAVVIPLAKVLHAGEALLLFLALVAWHLYHVNLAPGVFPLDPSIFTGRISHERLRREHGREHARLTAGEAVAAPAAGAQSIPHTPPSHEGPR